MLRAPSSSPTSMKPSGSTILTASPWVTPGWKLSATRCRADCLERSSRSPQFPGESVMPSAPSGISGHRTTRWRQRHGLRHLDWRQLPLSPSWFLSWGACQPLSWRRGSAAAIWCRRYTRHSRRSARSQPPPAAAKRPRHQPQRITLPRCQYCTSARETRASYAQASTRSPSRTTALRSLPCRGYDKWCGRRAR
jgi:hypothetical protein